MTSEQEKNKTKGSLRSKGALIIFVLTTALLFIYNDEAKEGFVRGLRLSALSVIPAIFPFFILSDFLFAFYEPKKGFFSSLFERIFGITASGFKAYLIGIICGFPLGVKCASELYRQNKITLNECERLSTVASSPSLAFVISGVGAGLRGSLKEGILLYLCVIISSFFTGILFKSNSQKIKFSAQISEQSFDLANSIKRAAYSSVSVGAYISFFSIISVILVSLVKNELLILFITSFLEIGNASVLISNSSVLSPALNFSLTAFALGFSGLSVFMQGLEYLPKEASKSRILFMKLIQGCISFLSAGIIFRLFL